MHADTLEESPMHDLPTPANVSDAVPCYISPTITQHQPVEMSNSDVNQERYSCHAINDMHGHELRLRVLALGGHSYSGTQDSRQTCLKLVSALVASLPGVIPFADHPTYIL